MRLSRFLISAVAAATLLLSLGAAQAQSVGQADAAYDGWLKADLIKSGGKSYFSNSLTDRSMAFMWGQAYIITGVLDAYQANQSSERRQLVVDLIATFEAQNGTDLA